MWDDPAPTVGNNAQPFDESDPAANVAWTDGQIMRLENEWRRAQRSFAYHPIIGIAPLRGDPPYEYQVDYRVRTVVMNEAGELQYVDEVSMHLWMPPGFPNQPPVMRPMASVFHPNIAMEGVYLTRPWHANDSLVDFVARIGELLAYRSYDPESVVNSVAMDWLTENSGMLPLDNRADFSPYAGGEPLGRIHRMGPETLDQIRRALDDMRFALMAEEGAPTQAEVDDFARKTRALASLFLDGDVQDRLREQAAECDDWCRELPASAPLWEYLRGQRIAVARTEFAVTTLRNAAAAFGAALSELGGLVRADKIATPADAAAAIPAMATLQPMQMKLPPLARDFEQRAAEIRGLLDTMNRTAPEVNVAPEGSLGRRLATQSETAREATAAAIVSATAALGEVEPLLQRARPELDALEEVVAWREYMDMFGKARAMEKQLAEWGSSGVHAFFLGNSSGSFGPFQFEEPLDLGAARIVVRNPQDTQIEVIDAFGQNVLGRGAGGTVTVVLGQAGKKPGHPNTFRLTGRCDDLAVQLDFIHQHTLDAMGQFHKPVNGAASWCGKVGTLLADGRQQQKLRDTHRKASHRWKSLMTDLAHLLKFKERLATYYLVSRMGEEVPRIQEMIAKVDLRLNDATHKVQAIMGKSSRNVETDQLVVPPKLVQAYSDELRARDLAKHEIARLQGVLKHIAKELATRLASPRLCGKPEIPPFRSLAPLSETILELEKDLSDGAIKKQVAALEKLLNVKLPIGGVPAAAAPARPAQPGAAGAAQDVANDGDSEDKPEEKPREKTRGRFTDRLLDRFTDRFSEKPSEKSAEEVNEEPSQTTGDGSSEKPADKVAEKPTAGEAAPARRPRGIGAPIAPPAPSTAAKPRRPVGPPVAVDPLLPRNPAATAKPAAPLAPPPAKAPEPKKPIVFPTPQPIGEPLAAPDGSIFGAFAENSAATPASSEEVAAEAQDEVIADFFGDDDDAEDGNGAG